jgi:small multidrug resistance pump
VIAYALGLFSAVLVATSQVLLKIGATRHGGSAFLRQYLNGYVLSGYVLFFLVTVVNVYVFSLVPLKMANIFVAVAYVGVLFFSWLFLGEAVHKDRLIGVVLIVTGIGLYVL